MRHCHTSHYSSCNASQNSRERILCKFPYFCSSGSFLPIEVVSSYYCLPLLVIVGRLELKGKIMFWITHMRVTWNFSYFSWRDTGNSFFFFFFQKWEPERLLCRRFNVPYPKFEDEHNIFPIDNIDSSNVQKKTFDIHEILKPPNLPASQERKPKQQKFPKLGKLTENTTLGEKSHRNSTPFFLLLFPCCVY